MIRAQQQEYYQETRDARQAYIKKYYRAHPEVWREAARKWLSNPRNRLSHSITRAMWQSLKENKGGCHWETLVDFTLQELVVHLESQFIDGMSWNNYGEWHIDHIRPVDSFNFDFHEDEEFKKCWSLKNLQPLW